VRRHVKASFAGSTPGGTSAPHRIATFGLLALSVVALLAFAPLAAAAPKTVVDSIGAASTAKTAGAFFNAPKGVAVNETGAGGVPAGSFYVVDATNRRIQQFGSTGDFVRIWGWGVKDGGGEFEICTVAAGCQKGLSGNGAGQLNAPQGIAVDQANGNLYVTDQSSRRVNIFSATGVFEGAFGWGVQSGAAAFQFCTAVSGCRNSAAAGAGPGRFGAAIGYPAVDSAGKIYVADITNRRVDVFTPTLTGAVVTGVSFLEAFGFDVSTVAGTGFEVCTAADCKQGTGGAGVGQFAATSSPSQVAVDSTGNIFALDSGNERVQQFSPAPAPAPLTETFGSAALSSAFGPGATLQNLAIDSSVDHVYVSGLDGSGTVRIAELDSTGAAVATHGADLTTNAATGLAVAQPSLGANLYLSTAITDTLHGLYILNEAPTMDPVSTFAGTTATFTGAVVSNEFNVTYHFEYSIDGGSWTEAPDAEAGEAPGTIAVQQEVTGLSGSQLYRVRLVSNRPAGGGPATSTETTFTTAAAAPAISATAASSITPASATLNASLDPQNQATSYHFEYGTADCSANPCAALPAQELSAGPSSVAVAQALTGLQPNTVYHYRLVASNGTGPAAGPDQTFATFAPGASLPDNRAYELVSPADTNGATLGALSENRSNFNTSLVSPDGEGVLFYSQGSPIPGIGGNGVINGYQAVRGPSGWTSGRAGPSHEETEIPIPGGASPDHGYAFWRSGNEGSLSPNGEPDDYLRLPSGGYEPIGLGSLGEDRHAEGRLITSAAGHVIFTTEAGFSVQLEPEAPASGIAAVYDRTPGGPTHVVSLLPGDVTPAADANFQGVSEDGSAVAFTVEGTLYERRDNDETLEAAPGEVIFGGLSRNGDRAFYVVPEFPGAERGEIFAFNANTETAAAVGGPESLIVNVSADGSRVYFSSHQELGGEGEAGADNLYVWDGTVVRFIATLDPRDFESFGGSGNVSLKEWPKVIGPSKSGQEGVANDPSRTTPDGSVVVFQSHGVAGYPYDSNGFSEIYRYEIASDELTCVSCASTATGASSEAELTSTRLTSLGSPMNAVARMQNVTDDGSAVFFQTSEALVPDDTDGVDDVYEWKEGRLALISSGRSTVNNYLYGMTSDGHDVFIRTSDALVPGDRTGGSGSIYDARIGGGFPPPIQPAAPCSEASCQGQGSPPPLLPTPASSAFQGPGDVKPARHRKKSQKKHHKKQRHQKKKKSSQRSANHNRGGAK